MGAHSVGSVDQFPEGTCRVVEVAGRSIGICNIRGEYYALRNLCAHQGGPACDSRIFPTVEAEVTPAGKIREYNNMERPVVACPWHGWEYDIKTGVCLADSSRRIATYAIEVQDSQLLVVL